MTLTVRGSRARPNRQDDRRWRVPGRPHHDHRRGREGGVRHEASPPGRAAGAHDVFAAPGIGKSTVVLAALHRPQVAARFGERRFFVRLDAAPGIDSAVAALADALEVAPGPDLRRRAVARLSAEAANINAMILRGLQGASPAPWIDAALALTGFACAAANAVPSLIERALEAARRAGEARRDAACLKSLGDIALARRR